MCQGHRGDLFCVLRFGFIRSFEGRRKFRPLEVPISIRISDVQQCPLYLTDDLVLCRSYRYVHPEPNDSLTTSFKSWGIYTPKPAPLRAADYANTPTHFLALRTLSNPLFVRFDP